MKGIKLKNTLTLFLLCFFSYSHAQIIDVKTCDSINRFPITNHTSILRTNSLISLDSVLHPDSRKKFMLAPDNTILIFNYDPYYYWFRIIIKNDENFSKDVVLIMAPIGLKEGKLYSKLNDHWKLIGLTGTRVPFINRPYQFSHFVFPLEIPGLSIDTLYLSTDANGIYKSFGFSLMKPRVFKAYENRLYFTFGIIVGLLFLFFLLNLYLFVFVKNTIYLWYALYIALVFLMVMKNDHLDQQFLHLDSELGYRLTPYMTIGSTAFAVLMHVVQKFFKQYLKVNIWLYKAGISVKYNVFMIGVVHYIFLNINSNYKTLKFIFEWYQYSILLAILFIIIYCIYSILKDFKSAYFILAGQLMFLIGIIQRLFFPNTLTYLFPPTTFHIGIVFETLIISFTLIYQYRSERYINRKKEKSYKQGLRKAQLEVQEQTIMNLFKEIDGNIGRTLTEAKVAIAETDSRNDTSNEKLLSASNMISKAIRDLRDLSKTLHTDLIEEIGILKALQYEIDLNRKLNKYILEFKVEGTQYRLPHSQELIIFRIFHEAITNVNKHAHASLVTVNVFYTESSFVLNISDNGFGFNLSLLIDQSSYVGIKTMRSRSDLIGAVFEIRSEYNKGTFVQISLPVDNT